MGRIAVVKCSRGPNDRLALSCSDELTLDCNIHGEIPIVSGCRRKALRKIASFVVIIIINGVF